jgi:ProP effector
MGFEKLEQLKLSLAKEAETIKPATGKPLTKVDQVVLDISRLQKLYPKAFPKNPLPKVPLKIGTLDDLISRSKEIGLSDDNLKSALHTWCSTKRYWISVKAGAQRLDLDGNFAGEVQTHEAAHANALFKKSKKSTDKISKSDEID